MRWLERHVVLHDSDYVKKVFHFNLINLAVGIEVDGLKNVIDLIDIKFETWKHHLFEVACTLFLFNCPILILVEQNPNLFYLGQYFYLLR